MIKNFVATIKGKLIIGVAVAGITLGGTQAYAATNNTDAMNIILGGLSNIKTYFSSLLVDKDMKTLNDQYTQVSGQAATEIVNKAADDINNHKENEVARAKTELEAELSRLKTELNSQVTPKVTEINDDITKTVNQNIATSKGNMQTEFYTKVDEQLKQKLKEFQTGK